MHIYMYDKPDGMRGMINYRYIQLQRKHDYTEIVYEMSLICQSGISKLPVLKAEILRRTMSIPRKLIHRFFTLRVQRRTERCLSRANNSTSCTIWVGKMQMHVQLSFRFITKSVNSDRLGSDVICSIILVCLWYAVTVWCAVLMCGVI